MATVRLKRPAPRYAAEVSHPPSLTTINEWPPVYIPCLLIGSFLSDVKSPRRAPDKTHPRDLAERAALRAPAPRIPSLASPPGGPRLVPSPPPHCSRLGQRRQIRFLRSRTVPHCRPRRSRWQASHAASLPSMPPADPHSAKAGQTN